MSINLYKNKTEACLKNSLYINIFPFPFKAISVQNPGPDSAEHRSLYQGILSYHEDESEYQTLAQQVVRPTSRMNANVFLSLPGEVACLISLYLRAPATCKGNQAHQSTSKALNGLFLFNHRDNQTGNVTILSLRPQHKQKQKQASFVLLVHNIYCDRLPNGEHEPDFATKQTLMSRCVEKQYLEVSQKVWYWNILAWIG